MRGLLRPGHLIRCKGRNNPLSTGSEVLLGFTTLLFIHN